MNIWPFGAQSENPRGSIFDYKSWGIHTPCRLSDRQIGIIFPCFTSSLWHATQLWPLNLQVEEMNGKQVMSILGFWEARLFTSHVSPSQLPWLWCAFILSLLLVFISSVFQINSDYVLTVNLYSICTLLLAIDILC